MKKFLSLCCFCLLAALSVPALAAPALHLKDNTVVLENNGKKTELPGDTFAPQDVQGADLRFVATGSDGKDAFSIEPGLYLFDKAGKMVAFMPSEEAEMCSEVRLSPKGDILAMDVGAWLVRSWFFYTYPGLKELGSVEYYQAEEMPALLWNGETGALFSSMSHAPHSRQCDYDPCGPVSVSAYSFKNRNVKTLLQGTDLCDFILADFAPDAGGFVAEKLCLPSAAAWRAFPVNASVESISVNPGTSNK